MNDESAFLTHLTDNPGDETARGAYADWLDDRERYADAARQRRMVPGCRALARNERKPVAGEHGPWFRDNPALTVGQVEASQRAEEHHAWWRARPDEVLAEEPERMWADWFDLIETPYVFKANEFAVAPTDVIISKDFFTEAEAVEAAALAFAMLPADRQAQILSSPPEGSRA